MKMETPLQTKECVVIIGSYINACSLTERLYDMKYPYPVVILSSGGGGTCLADIAAKNALVIKRTIRSDNELVEALEQISAPSCRKIVMFTAEEYMNTVRNAVESGRLQNVRTFTGAGAGSEVILDRTRFYQFIQGLGCLEVPRTVESDQDPFALFGESFIVRPKESWHGQKIHQRVRSVSGRAEFDACVRKLRAEGLTPEMWTYQELLSTKPEHNLSICGWHDESFKQYGAHRKVMQHPPKTGSADVMEIVNHIPRELLTGVDAVLSAMEYAGPFEFEFVFSEREGVYKAIELNPRFWLEHTLINRLTDDSLIRRYLGETGLQPIPPQSLPHKYWVNGNRALYYMLTGRFQIFRYLRNGFCYPTLWQSFRWGFHYFKFKRRLKNR